MSHLSRRSVKCLINYHQLRSSRCPLRRSGSSLVGDQVVGSSKSDTFGRWFQFINRCLTGGSNLDPRWQVWEGWDAEVQGWADRAKLIIYRKWGSVDGGACRISTVGRVIEHLNFHGSWIRKGTDVEQDALQCNHVRTSGKIQFF